MTDKSILGNSRTIKSFPDCYKVQKMCNRAVDNYRITVDAFEFVPECSVTQEMCDKAVNRCFLYLILFLIGIKLKKCVTKLFLKILF